MPIGLDEPYRIVVGNNPVNKIDPEGLSLQLLLEIGKRIITSPMVQRATVLAQNYWQRFGNFITGLMQRGCAYQGEGGVIALGRFGQNKAALEALAQKYGARILDKPFPKGVGLESALRAEIDAAEKIYFRMKDVVPGTISYDIEYLYIKSRPDLWAKTQFFYE